MPYAFPPKANDIPAIRDEVESAKYAVQLNPRLRDHVITTIRRFGFGNPDQIKIATQFITHIIDNIINPGIQNLILDPSNTTSHRFYQMRSPSEGRRKNIKRYQNVSLFTDRKKFENDSISVCQRIYSDPAIVAIKSVAILNFIEHAFWTECSYFINPDNHDDYENSF